MHCELKPPRHVTHELSQFRQLKLVFDQYCPFVHIVDTHCPETSTAPTIHAVQFIEEVHEIHNDGQKLFEHCPVVGL